MPLPRVRFTVRRLMVAVAVVGLALWLGKGLIRHWRYRSLAAAYATKESLARRLSTGDVTATSSTLFATRPGEQPVTSVMANRDYYAAMREKYERAARSPWLPVAPDPPEPE